MNNKQSSPAANKKKGKRLTAERIERLRRLGELGAGHRAIAGAMELSQSGVTWTLNGKRHKDVPRIAVDDRRAVLVDGSDGGPDALRPADIEAVRALMRSEGGYVAFGFQPDPQNGFKATPTRITILKPGTTAVDGVDLAEGVVTPQRADAPSFTDVDDLGATKGAA